MGTVLQSMKEDQVISSILQYCFLGGNIHLSEQKALEILRENNVSSFHMRIIYKHIEHGRVDQPIIVLNGDEKEKYLLYLVEHIKFVCFKDYCIIFNSHEKMNLNFVRCLNEYFKWDKQHFSKCQQVSKLMSVEESPDSAVYIKVLNEALETIHNKHRKHVSMIKPALDQLLDHIEDNPGSFCMKQLLAVKKSLTQIQGNVRLVMESVEEFSQDLEDFEYHQDVENTVKYFVHNVADIDLEIKMMIGSIEDTDQYVSIHLDTVRNKLMTMTLFIEFGALTCGIGMMIGGFFGMNLRTGLEDDLYAFGITIILTFSLMAAFFGWLVKTYYKLETDTTSAHRFKLLKSFFSNVDDLEDHISGKHMKKKHFRTAVEKITNLQITEKENNYLFKLLDANNDGVINVEKDLNLEIKSTDINDNGSYTAGWSYINHGAAF